MTTPATPATARTSAPFSLRPATPDDTAALTAVYTAALAKAGGGLALAGAPQTAPALDLMSQTGSAFVVAERDGRVAGAVRYWDDDGIAWFDLLAAGAAGAGRALVRNMETGAQDRGLRLIRARMPEESRLPAAFSRWGYRPISRTVAAVDGQHVAMLVLEKRLPLLTVREQRRSDAAAIGELTGEDPWVFEQGARPGWFVASDGDRLVGVISVRDAGAGVATISQPVLAESHRGRGIEVWMVERCAVYAETNGYHTAEMPLSDATDAHRKALEDRLWQREPPLWVKRFRSNAPVADDD